VNSLLSRARETTKNSQQESTLPVTDPDVAEFLGRYVGAWRSADINAFVELVGEDVRLSMPPMSTWYRGRDSVAGFVEAAIFAPSRPYGVSIVAGTCNGQPAFAVYQPDESGALVVGGLQVLQLTRVAGDIAISDIVSYRDAALALQCSYPAILTGEA
jgi:RNA polymerase sigma-70 factor (ECF subfamily)